MRRRQNEKYLHCFVVSVAYARDEGLILSKLGGLENVTSGLLLKRLVYLLPGGFSLGLICFIDDFHILFGYSVYRGWVHDDIR